jgi:hypothetical protein
MHRLVGCLGGTCCCFLLGCQVVGPGTLRRERPEYNEALQRTNQEQTFVNIVRIFNFQEPLHMEVTEMDVIPSTSGTLTGGLNPAGGPTQTGNVAGSLGYAENSTIRITPTLGQAEVSQLSTPLSVESLSNVIHSGFPLNTILDLGISKLTPSVKDRDQALEDLQWLWFHSAISVGTGKVQNSQQDSQQSSSAADSLLIVAHRPLSDRISYPAPKSDLAFWRELQGIFNGAPDESNDVIVLQTLSKEPITTKSGIPKLVSPLAPTIEARSAIGILREGEAGYRTLSIGHAQGHGTILFVTPGDYEEEKSNATAYFYFNKGDTKHHYILINVSPAPPSTRPFLSYFDRRTGLYYYIRDDDQLSKQTFSLLHLFIIIQSAPTAAPLTPTIPIGGASH